MGLELKIEPPKILPELDDFAVVLCGGGAAGRWQAGVLAALAQKGVLEQTSVMAGTSVGGLNTGLFTAYGAVDFPEGEVPSSPIEEMPPPPPGSEPDINEDDIPSEEPPPTFMNATAVWESIKDNKDVYNGAINSLFDKVAAGFGFIFGKRSILDPKPLYAKLDKLFKDSTLEDLHSLIGIHMIVSSLDLNAQREEFYCSFGPNKGMKVADALKRTSAIPAIFPSVKGVDIDKDGKKHTHWHVDGGAGANNPFIALNKYNTAFPNKQVKKVIVVFCYPDEYVDIGTGIVAPDNTKSYEAYRDAILQTVPASMNAQEQVAEEIIKDKVKTAGWDVLALYPKDRPCDALDFTKTKLLQEGYNYGINGKGYSYKSDNEVDVIDFLKKV